METNTIPRRFSFSAEDFVRLLKSIEEESWDSVTKFVQDHVGTAELSPEEQSSLFSHVNGLMKPRKSETVYELIAKAFDRAWTCVTEFQTNSFTKVLFQWLQGQYFLHFEPQGIGRAGIIM